jgi:hypothetical protein
MEQVHRVLYLLVFVEGKDSGEKVEDDGGGVAENGIEFISWYVIEAPAQTAVQKGVQNNNGQHAQRFH